MIVLLVLEDIPLLPESLFPFNCGAPEDVAEALEAGSTVLEVMCWVMVELPLTVTTLVVSGRVVLLDGAAVVVRVVPDSFAEDVEV